MHRIRTALMDVLKGLTAAILLAVSPLAWSMPLNMSTGVTGMSRDIYHLHMLAFWICVAIGVGVFAVMFYALIMHRKSKGHQAAHFHESLTVEIVWTVIPCLILVGLAIPATKVLLRMKDTAQPEVNIKITGIQWKWRYDYLDEGIGFYSSLSTTYDQIHNQAPKGPHYLLEVDKPLVLPIHKKIRFLITSNDVNHSWWVPALALKKDAIPGVVNEAWTRIDKPGTYRGQCTELCGMHHGYMPIVVKAVSESDYQAWLASQGVAHHAPKRGPELTHPPANHATVPAIALDRPKTFAVLMQTGKGVYQQHCAVCHQGDGHGMPPVFPALKGSKVVTGPVAGQIQILLHGVKGTAMQAFGEQLNNLQISSVITYVRNSWGNSDRKRHGPHAGGTVQPADIAHARHPSHPTQEHRHV